jgi:hypothetical protein
VKFADIYDSDKIAVQCTTNELAEEVFKLFIVEGIKWYSGKNLKTNDTSWNDCGELTCYSIHKGLTNRLQYGDYNYYINNGYTVIKAEDLINSNKQFSILHIEYKK